MPTFTFTSRDDKGLVQIGHVDAVDEDQVVAILQHRGLLVTSITRKELAAHALLAVRRRKHPMHTGITVDDQVLLCEQLATLVQAGVPILRSLAVVSAQVESRRLFQALEAVSHDVEGGLSLHAALAKHPAVFSKLWLSLVETGEASGHLAESLQHLSRHFEAARHLQNAVKTALTYPVFLMAMAIAVLGIFVYWLIPKFTGMFTQMNIELPWVTRAIVWVSDAARQYFVGMAFGVIAVSVALRRYLRTEAGQWVRDRMLLRLPMINGLIQPVQLAECFRGLSTLCASGVPLLSSLEILAHSATNKVFGEAIGQIRDAVREGKSMAEPMARLELFPPMTVQMVQVGEEVGELAKMSGRIAAYYESQVELFIGQMTRLFEPIAIVVMGVLVLFVVLGIFMPIFKIAGGVIG
ncbi:MAG: type II secretion system F family protein [Candidatus Omnitrophota bacterium]|nr:type II secretion system F family protein [Candidatus Omnitrophota bacterium]